MKAKSELRIAFLGTPEFAVPSLKMLLEEGYRVCGVFTQPDRPKGRGHKLVCPPVKLYAQQEGVPVFQFERISRDGMQALEELAPDLAITVAFGQILSRKLLESLPLGCINVHASLLPKYRGAAPIEQAIIRGEKITGITTMCTVYELDAGDILEQDEIAIAPEDTGGSLREKLSLLGAKTLKRTLQKMLDGTLRPLPQAEDQATYYPMFQKGFGEVDFEKSAEEVVNFIRGINPSPGAFARLGDQKIKFFFAKKVQEAGVPGEVLHADEKNGLVVACGEGAVKILRLQYPGAKQMDIKDFLRGRSGVFTPGIRLGQE